MSPSRRKTLLIVGRILLRSARVTGPGAVVPAIGVFVADGLQNAVVFRVLAMLACGCLIYTGFAMIIVEMIKAKIDRPEEMK